MNSFKAQRATLCVLVFLIVSTSPRVFAQLEIPVDMYTGRPSITVPLTSISSMDIKEGVQLSYNSNGPLQLSPFGGGWNLDVGGAITREVRTYPDDVGFNVTTKGWLYSNSGGTSIALDIGNFVPAADTLAGARDAGEGTDYNKINGFNYLVDTEPDIFNYNFGGISGSFVFDNNGVIRTMPYRDVKIVVNQLNATDKRILGFTVTTNEGYIYTFNQKVTATKSTTESIYFNRNFYTTTEYEMYNPSVTYTREWKLTRIDSPNGAYMTFSYVTIGTTPGTPSDVGIGVYQNPDPFYANPSDLTLSNIYHVSETIEEIYPLGIVASTGAKIDFVYNGTLQTIKISDDRRGTTAAERFIKSFDFTYHPVTFYYNLSEGQGVFFESGSIQLLKSVTEYSGCERMPPYKFDYRGLEKLQYHTGDYLRITGNGVDLWGYRNGATYNPHLIPKLYIYPSEPESERYRTYPYPGHTGSEIILQGVSRASSSAGMSEGLLNSITNPTGGVTSFFFEGNQYLDTKTSLNVPAGGLRIKTISYYDGFSSTPVKKEFNYTDPATGLSSGVLIRKPVLAMPALKWKSPGGPLYDKDFSSAGPTADDKWKYLTVRTAADITPKETTHGSPVGYKVVTVKRSGSGSVRYEFLIPGIHGQFVNGQWKATTNRFARSASGQSMGIVSNGGPWMFPHAPNPYFEYKQGLVWRTSDFNEAGKLVKKVVTTYQDIYKTNASGPTIVSGLRYDRYAGSDNNDKIFFYGKYALPTEAVVVPKSDTVTNYDITDVSGNTYLKETTEYFYSSAYHRLLTQVKRTSPDGTVYNDRFKYADDYVFTIAGGANTEALAINSLKAANRRGLPMEQISTFQKVGDFERVISGSVIKPENMNGRPQVRSTWKLKTNPSIRIDSFYYSNVTNSNPYKFRIDRRYQRVDSILAYNAYGNVKSSRSPMAPITSVTGYGFGSTMPVVQLKNAAMGQASFSDFETTTGMNFSTATPYYGSGRTGKNALHPSVILYDTITKASVDNYILSFWIKSNANVSFTLKLRSQNGGTDYSTTSFTIPSSGGSAFVYFQKRIPTGAGVLSPFRFELQATGLTAPGASSPGLLPVIDDIFFYPENAEMSAVTYAIPFGVASNTNGDGRTQYNEFDKIGRLRFVYDKNKNIVQRNIYTFSNESPLVADFSIPYPYTLTAGIATTLTAFTNDCVTDATYQWDTGSGFVSGGSTLSVSFPAVGTYAVSLKVTSATFGIRTITKNVNVAETPFPISICAEGIVNFVGGVPDVINDCASIAGSPSTSSSGVTFRVTHSAGGTITYQWKRRDLGSSTWVDVGSNSDFYVIVTNNATRSYEVKCVINSSTHGIGNSPSNDIIFE